MEILSFELQGVGFSKVIDVPKVGDFIIPIQGVVGVWRADVANVRPPTGAVIINAVNKLVIYSEDSQTPPRVFGYQLIGNAFDEVFVNGRLITYKQTFQNPYEIPPQARYNRGW